MVDYNFIDLLVSLVLAFIMLSIGMSLKFEHFSKILSYPKIFFSGLTLQMIALPMLAFVIATIANLPPEFKMGLVILSTCPGGTTSNFITYLFDGNTALSICLTSINSLITVFSIPLIVNLGLSFFANTSSSVQLSLEDTMLQVFLITIVPVSIGLILNYLSADFVCKIQKPLKRITIVLLGIVFLIKFLAAEDQGGSGINQQEILAILPYAITMNFIALLLGYLVASYLRFKQTDRLTIGIEVGMQNTTLAFLIAGTLLQNPEMTKPALVYAMFTFWTALIFAYFVKPKKTPLYEVYA